MRGDVGMSFIKRSGLPPGRVPEERASVSPTLDSIRNHSRNATIGQIGEMPQKISTHSICR